MKNETNTKSKAQSTSEYDDDDIPKVDLPKTKSVEPLPESERPRKDGPGGN